MLDIRCEVEGEPPRLYSVFGFMALSDAEQALLRQSLYCLGCGAKAYFRRASLDGKAACFGSLYHRDDCPEYHPSVSRSEEAASLAQVREAMANQDAISLELDAVSIDLDARVRLGSKTKPVAGHEPQTLSAASVGPHAFSSPLAPPPPGMQSLSEPQRNLGTQASPQSAPTSSATAKLGLKQLLQSLLRGSELGRSDLWIYTDAVHSWRAKNLLVNFADAEPTENGAPRLYWGNISHADKALNWLNPVDNREL
ncbi:MAG: hypothetical protein ACRC7Q_07770, partial [Plesiomonas shigelloides]